MGESKGSGKVLRPHSLQLGSLSVLTGLALTLLSSDTTVIILKDRVTVRKNGLSSERYRRVPVAEIYSAIYTHRISMNLRS